MHQDIKLKTVAYIYDIETLFHNKTKTRFFQILQVRLTIELLVSNPHGTELWSGI